MLLVIRVFVNIYPLRSRGAKQWKSCRAKRKKKGFKAYWCVSFGTVLMLTVYIHLPRRTHTNSAGELNTKLCGFVRERRNDLCLRVQLNLARLIYTPPPHHHHYYQQQPNHQQQRNDLLLLQIPSLPVILSCTEAQFY